ncbi:MAG: hypothetical protein ABW123_22840 [Cystobacter sp.]
MSPIRPTHTCFDDALEYLGWRAKETPEQLREVGRFFLVHAICLVPEGKRKGEPFAHAWVEERISMVGPPGYEWVVWQDGFLNDERITYGCPAEVFRAAMQVVEETRYTPRQAHEENARTMTFGPWVERYKALCAGPNRKVEVFTPNEGDDE